MGSVCLERPNRPSWATVTRLEGILTMAQPNWRDIGDVPLDTWARTLEAVGSPMMPYARDTWQAARPHAAICLAMLSAESRFGTRYNRNTGLNLNPLNLRPRGGAGFQAFASFAACVAEWRARISDPAYAYATTVTLADLVNVYAPRSENDTGAYVRTVQSLIDGWPKEGSVPATIDYKGLPFPVTVRLIPATQTNQRPGTPMRPTSSTWHETANTSAGAGARMHADWLHNGAPGGADKQVSFHFVVDDREAYQLIPLDEIAWHAGDGGSGPGNRSSIAFECCVNKDGDLRKAQDNMARLMAHVAAACGFPAANVYQHNKWSGKNCPTLLRAEPAGWDRILKLINGYAAAPTPTTPTDTTAVTYPAGLSQAMAAKLFGSLSAGGKVWEFSPVGPVSRLWLTLGRYPRLVGYESATDGAQWWLFADGTVFWQPKAGAAVQVVK